MKEKIEILEYFVNKIRQKEVKAIWAIKHEEEWLIILLVDDLKTNKEKIKEIEIKALKLAEEILKKYKVILHPDLLLVSEFYSLITQNKIDVFLEIKKAICLYDTGFFMPIKALVEKGEIKGTKEALFKLIAEVRSNLKELRNIKLNALSNIYTAIIDAAESALMVKGLSFFIPKEIPKLLEKEFFKKRMISKKTLEAFKDIYNTYKAYEYGEINDMDGKKLDELIKKADLFISEMQDLVSKSMEK